MVAATHVPVNLRRAAHEQLTEIAEKHGLPVIDTLDILIDEVWEQKMLLTDNQIPMIYDTRSKTYRKSPHFKFLPSTEEEFVKQYGMKSEIEILMDYAMLTDKTIIILHHIPDKLMVKVKCYITRLGLNWNEKLVECNPGKVIFVDPSHKYPTDFIEYNTAKIYLHPDCKVGLSEYNGGWQALIRRDKRELDEVVKMTQQAQASAF